jgi:glycosyltransferase involved in cell wall biosynthesis
MKISVIVPFYNSAMHIEKCITALLSQNYPSQDFEIIMIDNNSTDLSRSIVRKYPSITLLSEKKQGSYAARNLGIRRAEGEILAFTDADCIPDANWLKKISDAISCEDILVAVGIRHSDSDSKALKLLDCCECAHNEYVFNSGERDLYYGYTNNMAAVAELFEELDEFTERKRGGDTIFIQRVVSKHSCEAVGFFPAMRITHMEMNGLFAYFEKMFVYGRSRRKYRDTARIRALRPSESMHILRKTIVSEDCSMAESMLLLLLIGFGSIFWSIGTISAIGSSKIID